MKHTTERARLLYLYGGEDGVRITCVRELESASKASQRAIRQHLPTWRLQAQNMAENRQNSHLSIVLSAGEFEAHKSDVEFMRSEVDRLQTHLRSLSPSDETYCAVSRALIATERQWLAFSGVGAILEASTAGMKESAKQKAKVAATANPEGDEDSTETLSVGFKRRS